MPEQQTLNLADRKEYRKFKRLYNNAVKSGDKIFKFKGQDVLVDYAKYLLEYTATIPGVSQ